MLQSLALFALLGLALLAHQCGGGNRNRGAGSANNANSANTSAVTAGNENGAMSANGGMDANANRNANANVDMRNMNANSNSGNMNRLCLITPLPAVHQRAHAVPRPDVVRLKPALKRLWHE